MRLPHLEHGTPIGTEWAPPFSPLLPRHMFVRDWQADCRRAKASGLEAAHDAAGISDAKASAAGGTASITGPTKGGVPHHTHQASIRARPSRHPFMDPYPVKVGAGADIKGMLTTLVNTTKTLAFCNALEFF